MDNRCKEGESKHIQSTLEVARNVKHSRLLSTMILGEAE